MAGESAPGWHWNTPAPRQRGVPLPAVLTGELGAGPFVGRAERRSSACAHATHSAAQGRRQVVVLAGEPGIGKSRLAIEFARETHAHGATVLFGRSDPESLVPYQPFVTRRPARDGPPRQRRAAGRAGAGAVRAGPARPGPATAPARAARAARRRSGDAPLPHVRGGHAAARLPRRASARSCCSSTTCNGPTRRPRCCSATCCATSRPPGCSCSAPSATATTSAARSCPRCWASSPASRRSSGSRSSGLDAEETGDLIASLRRCQRLVRPAPARRHRGQPVLRQGDDAQPRRRARTSRTRSRG